MNALRIRINPYFGLNTYDFSARRQYPMVGRFDSPDPLAHKTPWLSPYAFCGGDPVNFSDPSGMRISGNSIEEWEKHKACITERVGALSMEISNTVRNGNQKGC